MKRTYEFSGTCSRSVTFDIDENGVLHGISFMGGCNGNLKGISALCEGLTAAEVIERLKGIRCGFKSTSCPDQFARALEKEIRAE
ncbi:MAG: TIGR03905 family TSCPD domain-containing protein [Clostridia bacterium]|nr:TIGR03905 family TSCPD domain-containing protein [Clostridia bacterium]